MDTINWLHIRGLALLALLGLFILYAVLVASWHDWRDQRRKRLAPQRNALLAAEPFAGDTVGPAANPHAGHDEREADPMRRAA